MPLTRREFLLRVGEAGGYGAAFMAMQGLGLGPASGEMLMPIEAAKGVGHGKSVAILGGGMGGLVAAYELRELGFKVTVLEARGRPGGRNWTLRGGDTVKLTDGSEQRCEFDAGQYQNFGPARLPSTHTTMLGYCRKFRIELEVEVNTSRGSMLQNDAANGGKPVAQRQAVNDTRGRVAELLMKSLHQGALNGEITPGDRERMNEFLRFYGPLDQSGEYVGSERAGYTTTPGAGDQTGVLVEPLDLHTLLEAEFWNGMMYTEVFDQQATMFQPVGGMDRIPYAFAKELGAVVVYDAPVTEIRRTSEGVRVGYTRGGAALELRADYCICALPLTMLKKMPNDFGAEYQRVIADCTYAAAYKMAWESRRFWEMDQNIYGGLEFVGDGIGLVWLPSAKMFSERGVLVSGYGFDTTPEFAKLTLAQKIDASRLQVEKLHPGHGKELQKALFVSWNMVPWNEGSWIDQYGKAPSMAGAATVPGGGPVPAGGPVSSRFASSSNANYETLITPDGPFFFVGDHCSHIVGWQEGAALSAKRAVGMIVERAKVARA